LLQSRWCGPRVTLSSMWWVYQGVSFTVVLAAATAEWQYQRFWKQIAAAGNPAEIGFTRLLFLLCLLFDRERMHLVASICDTQLPKLIRVPVLWVVSTVMGCDLSEVKGALDSFPTIGDFFSRELREGSRQIDAAPGAVVSPADARVLAAGCVSNLNARVAQVQVKGTTFSLPGLLGTDPFIDLPKDRELMYFALHLGPGDYHRFHAPASFTVESGRRFSGEGLPVSPLVTGRANDVFSVNERVVLSGSWSGGRMHLVAVGAAHVRGIFLEFDPHLAKAMAGSGAPTDGAYYLDGRVTTAELPKGAGGVTASSGSMMGGFRLGSAVVCVFEAPVGSMWKVKAGERVKVGQQILSSCE